MRKRRSLKRKKPLFLLLLLMLPMVVLLGKRLLPKTPPAASPFTQQSRRHSQQIPLAAAQAGLTLDEDAWNVASQGYGWEEESMPSLVQADTQTGTSDPGAKPYPEVWDVQPECQVNRTFYSTYYGTRFFSLDTAGQVQNKTSLPNEQLMEESKHLPNFDVAADGTPRVLIMHTHTTETFEPYVRDNFDSSFNYRTTDPSKNMIAVGNAIAAQLEAAGIGVIHSDVIHDYPSYNGSYERSAETVRAILEQYPTIQVVLDIHRDAIGDDTAIAQPIVEIDGKEAAQIMIISGCDDGTMNMPHYMEKFHFACALQGTMESLYHGLTRPILFDYRHYNQDLTTGSLLIEVGSHGNTLDQAVYSGQLIGVSLAKTLLQQE